MSILPNAMIADTVDLDAVEAGIGAADADAAAFAVLAADLHAGHPLQGFGEVLVGELADVLGRLGHVNELALNDPTSFA